MESKAVTRNSKREVKRLVKSMIDAQLENKVIITQIAAAATPTAGTILNLSNDIAQGDNFNQRSGNIVTCIKHDIRLTSTATGTTNQVTRFIVFQDLQNNGAIPVVLDVLDTATYMSPYNSLNVYQAKRFRILKDVSMNLNVNGQTVKYRYVRLPKVGKIHYNGVGGSNASLGRGAVFILIVASASSGEYDFAWEMNYHDA